MMSKRFFKIGTVLLVCVCLVSFSVLSVSALSEVSFGNIKFASPSFRTKVSDTGGYSEPGSDVVTVYNQSSYDSNGIAIETYSVSSDGVFGGSTSYYRCMRGSISVPVTNGKKFLYLTVTPNIFFTTSNGDYDISLGDSTYFSNGGITSNPFLDVESTRDGKSVKFKVDLELYDTIYFQIATKIYNPWTDYILIFSDISLVGEDGTSIIINNQNQNSQNIINNQNNNTDKVTNGWNGGQSVDDGTTDALKDSESAALGGKTDAEIQAEVDNALNFDLSAFDSVKVGKVHTLFDGVLNAAGSGYQALFVLCLTLGLAAFIIGRRYG